MILNESNKNIYYHVAKITFFLYFFFTLFGTSLPFRAGTRDPSQLGTSNIINQIVFSTLFLTALFSLIPKTHHVIAIIKKEKFLIIFLLWCTLSIIWAENSFVVFKRLFQFYTAIIVCFSILVHSDSVDDILITLKILFSIFMIVSLISIFTVPGAISRNYHEWQGLANNKNNLGKYSLISTLIWLYALSKDENLKSKLFSIFMLLVSLFLLFGANSLTAVSAFLFLLLVWSLFAVDQIFKPLGIRRTVAILFLICLGSITVLTLLFSKEIIAAVLALAGKKLTLTGRTDLWADIMVEVKKHLLLGCGYKGFWITDSPKILEVYETYIWLPRQSHNGYLDVLNETGLIGLFSFLAIIINYFVTLVKNKEKTFWMWFIIVALIENFTESVLFSPGGVMTFMFLYAYLSIFTNILQKEQINFQSETDRLYRK
jgi:O-antigen ligase